MENSIAAYTEEQLVELAVKKIIHLVHQKTCTIKANTEDPEFYRLEIGPDEFGIEANRDIIKKAKKFLSESLIHEIVDSGPGPKDLVVFQLPALQHCSVRKDGLITLVVYNWYLELYRNPEFFYDLLSELHRKKLEAANKRKLKKSANLP